MCNLPKNNFFIVQVMLVASCFYPTASASDLDELIDGVVAKLQSDTRPVAVANAADARSESFKAQRPKALAAASNSVTRHQEIALAIRKRIAAERRLQQLDQTRARSRQRDFSNVLNSSVPAQVYQGEAGRYRAYKGEFRIPGKVEKSDDQIDFLTSRAELFGVDSDAELVAIGHWQSAVAGHQRFAREFQGTPVFGSEINLHFDDEGVRLIHGDFQEIDDNLDVTLQLQPMGAIAAGLAHARRDFSQLAAPPEVSKQIVRVGQRTVVAGMVTLTFTDLSGWVLFVDLRTGRVVRELPMHKPIVVSASGIDLQGVVQRFDAEERDGKFFLSNPEVPSQGTTILDALNTEGETLEFSGSDSLDSGWDPTGVSAFINLGIVYNYFLTTFGRDSVDDRGQELLGVIHFGETYDNAFWSNPYMVFGDGGGFFSPLAGCLDVVAHEVAHGVIENESNLIYQNQSGALNESFADFFGVMVDREDWRLGEDCTLGAPGYLRDMANPGVTGQPGHMSEFRVLPNTESGDNGGVHINSGIPNRAAYLMAEGLTAENLGISIGREKTEAILYETLRMLTPDAEFIDAKVVSITVAEQIYGVASAEAVAVETAWESVGVTAESVAAIAGGSRRVEGFSGDDFMVYLYPEDGSHDNPFDTDENYLLYAQQIPNPFIDYDETLDRGPLNQFGEPAYTPPAPLSIDGELVIFYVAENGDLWGTGRVGDEVILEDAFINSIAASQDGTRIALTFSGDRLILVIDLVTGETSGFEALGASYVDGDAVNLVTRVDSVGFDYSGRKVIFDYAACIPIEDPDACTGDDPSEFWSMGILDVAGGRFSYPFPTQSSDIDIGYPKFANNTNQFVVFDYLDWTDFEATGRARASVLVYDTIDKTFLFAGLTNIGDTRTFAYGVPSFSGDDQHIVHQVLGDGFGIAIQVALDDYRPNPDDFALLNAFDVAVPIAFRAGSRDVGAVLASDTGALDFGAVADGEPVQRTFVIRNPGNRTIEITDVSEVGSHFDHNVVPATLLPESSATYTVTFDPAGLSGVQQDVLSVDSDSDGGAVTVVFSATVLAGSDSDADGVTDTQDAFPDDSREQFDTDGDGLGNSVDPDDDGDGIADSYEVAIGLDPLDDDAAGDIDGDGLSNLAEFQQSTRAVQYLMTPSASSNVTFLHVINTSDQSQSFKGTLYNAEGEQLGLAGELLSSESVAPLGRIVLTSADIEQAFGIAPWSGPAMLEVTGTDSFELMSKLTSPSGLISNTNCVREDRVFNVEGADSGNQSFIRLINTTNRAMNQITGTLFSADGNAIGLPNVPLAEALAAKQAIWINREDLASLVGRQWAGTASLQVNADPGLKLLNLNFVNSETFFNFSCHESKSSRRVYLQTRPGGINRSFTDIVNTSRQDQVYFGTLFNASGERLGSAATPLSESPVLLNGRLTLDSDQIAAIFEVESWTGPAMLQVDGEGDFELVTRLTSPGGLQSNSNCVRQSEVHNVEGFDSPNRSFVRLINQGEVALADIRGSLLDSNGLVIGEANVRLVDSLAPQAAIWLDRNALSTLVSAEWQGEASLQITTPATDLRLLNLNFVNDETFFNFSCYEGSE